MGVHGWGDGSEGLGVFGQDSREEVGEFDVEGGFIEVKKANAGEVDQACVDVDEPLLKLSFAGW